MIIINGIEIQKFHNRYIRVFDNKIWMLLLRHNSEDGTKFSNKEDALYQTADERKYSILSTIPNGCEELKVDGKFEFFIEYPGYETGYNQWRQTNFPIYEEDSNTSVIGFEENHTGVLDDQTTTWRWKGLSLSSSSSALLDGSTFDGKWNFAFGAFALIQGYIPTYKNQGTKEQLLWMRVPSLSYFKCITFMQPIVPFKHNLLFITAIFIS